MASTAMEKDAAKMEAELKQLQAEMEAVKKDFAARLAALEAKLPAQETAPQEIVAVETLAMISAAVTAFLGKKVKIRSARQLTSVNPWAQAGRAIVQASHNLNR